MSTTTTKERPPAPTVRQYQPLTKVKTLQELWDHPGLKSRMEQLLTGTLTPDRLLRTLINAALKSPGLTKVHPMSMLGVAMTLAYLELEPNTPLQQVHVIPFDVTKGKKGSREREYIRTDANIIIGYQGYIQLIDRGKAVKDLDCELIWPGDTWEEERGTNKHFRHIPKHQPHAEGEEPDFAYMHARLLTGGEHIELMTRAEIHVIRNRSQGYQHAIRLSEEAQRKGWSRPPAGYTEAPWIKYPLAMFRKTPLRSGQKYLPKSAQLAVAITLDEANEGGRVRFDQILDAEHVSEGTWEVPEDQVDPEEELEATDSKDKPEPTRTTTSGKAAPQETKSEPEKPQSRQQDPNAPPDDRWGDGAQGTPAASAGATGQGSAGGTATRSEAAKPSEAQASEEEEAGFDEWLLDVNGEPMGDDPYTDPVAFAQALEREWQNPVGREALLQQNKDAMDKAAADPKAKAILDTLAQEDAAGAVDLTVAIPLTAGRKNSGQYLKDFRAAALGIGSSNYLDFLAANQANMIAESPSTRNLLVKAMAETADRLGIERPAALASILEGPKPDADADLARDNRAADARIAELQDCKDANAMRDWADGTVLKSFTDRLTREGKQSILDRLNAAWEKRKAEIATPKPRA